MRHIPRLIATSILMIIAAAGSAQESGIEGTWTGKAVVAPSQFSSGNEARAREFLQQRVKIEEQRILLPDQSVCSIQSPHAELWHNDMRTFGSFGGDWSEIGLQKSSSGFKVTTWKMDCADNLERLVQIVSQPESRILLLDVGRIFMVLQ